jgi:tripartite-type tricarboxylate transporter receptor subunit TctC
MTLSGREVRGKGADIMRKLVWASVIGAALMPCLAEPGRAQDDYPKTVKLIIGEATGGGYDTYARLLARYIGKYLPGSPTVVPQNMPGAGSLLAMNHIYTIAPRDGSVFGMVQRSVIIMPLLGIPEANFSPEKLNYVGSMDQEVGVCIVRRAANINSIEEVKHHEMIVGIEGAVSEVNSFTNPLTKMLGLKLKVVSGYHGAHGLDLAIDRGEIDGRCGMSYSSLKRSAIKDKVHILLQLGLDPDPELPHVPLAINMTPNTTDHDAMELLLAPTAIARPFFLPPGVPPERVAMLRKAFDQAMADPELRAEAKKLNIRGRTTSGAEMQARVERIYNMPASAITRAKEMVKRE